MLRDSVSRLSFLVQPHGELAFVDLRYAEHPWSTAVHLVPGILFFLVGPLQFSPGLRRRWPGLHRSLGKLFIASGFVSSLGVMHMVIVFPALGGLLTQGVTYAICLSMVAAMILAYRAIRRREVMLHMRWMRLAFALGLTVSTARIYITLADTVLSVPFEQSFTIASALGLATNLAVVGFQERRRKIARS
ncbi:DUF2306 domain-containing protein [Phaeobacter sp. CAU 1743]|uniref:DUF2306 domain-containing protein n=1 Tax=Phaeobacter sp. CAU 1743 TaxID=3140367 RepID=UPI00325C2A5A